MYHHMYAFVHYVSAALLVCPVSLTHQPLLILFHPPPPPLCGSGFSHTPPFLPTSLPLSPSPVPKPGGAGRLHGSGPQQRRSPEEPGPGACGRLCEYVRLRTAESGGRIIRALGPFRSALRTSSKSRWSVWKEDKRLRC